MEPSYLNARRGPSNLTAAIFWAACSARAPAPPVDQRPLSSLARFHEFEYEALPALGFCVDPGAPVHLLLSAQDGRLRVRRSVLAAEGTASARCLRLGRECTWVTETTGWLAADDARLVRETFGIVRIRRDTGGCLTEQPPEPCPPGQFCFQDDVIQASDPCRIDTFRWDRLEARVDACSEAAHLSVEDGTRLLGVLAALGR